MVESIASHLGRELAISSIGGVELGKSIAV